MDSASLMLWILKDTIRIESIEAIRNLQIASKGARRQSTFSTTQKYWIGVGP